jgi:hypothetical protein
MITKALTAANLKGEKEKNKEKPKAISPQTMGSGVRCRKLQGLRNAELRRVVKEGQRGEQAQEWTHNGNPDRDKEQRHRCSHTPQNVMRFRRLFGKVTPLPVSKGLT